MCNGFTNGWIIVVTRYATAQNLAVINRDHRHPDCFRMTGFACVCRGNMRDALARRDIAVMALHAVAQYRRVIDGNYRQPCRRAMTRRAIVGSLRMIGWFAG